MIEFPHAGNREDGKQTGWIALVDEQGDKMWRGWVGPVPLDTWGAMEDACGQGATDTGSNLNKED